MECPINLELKFSKIVVALPDRISFHESDGKFVGKILLHGNFNASAPQGNEVLIWASWNRESKVSDLDLEVKSTLIKPNMLSVTVFAEKQPSTQNRELHFMVGVNGAGVSVPAEFVDLKPSAGNLTKR